MVRLEARQEGDHIVLIIADDGHGISPERIRAKAVEKNIISEEEANTLDDRQSLNLIFLPGFSTMAQASSVSGRGVGMDVVKTNIQKLNGAIEIRSEPGKGSVFIISLPLTLAILPVLLVLLGEQPFALPLSMVREILPIDHQRMQEVGGKETLVVRGEILPVIALSRLRGAGARPTQRRRGSCPRCVRAGEAVARARRNEWSGRLSVWLVPVRRSSCDVHHEK